MNTCKLKQMNIKQNDASICSQYLNLQNLKNARNGSFAHQKIELSTTCSMYGAYNSKTELQMFHSLSVIAI